MDESKIEALITSRTKAIVPVHYAGVACDMHRIMELAKEYNLYVIEDAAQSIESFYTFPDGTKKPLGGIGHLAAFSFHETKNIMSGEGGLLVIREKGTNRSKFFRGEVDKYGWVDIGSSFLPSDILAAFLYAQLECIDQIQKRRLQHWNQYYNSLSQTNSPLFSLGNLPVYATNNAHMFYLLFKQPTDRTRVIEMLKEHGILSVFHYQSLHKSSFYSSSHQNIQQLLNSDRYTETLLRLPIFYELNTNEIDMICGLISNA